MIAALVCLAAASPPQLLKQLDVDRFNTPYSVQINGTHFDLHEWNGLIGSQCVFYRRATSVSIIANPNQTLLTFSLGQGLISFSSPKQVFWVFRLDYFTADGSSMDFSNVQRFYVDCDHIPDIAEMYAYDTSFNSGVTSWLLQPQGIYFSRTGLGSNLDWKHIYNVELRLDFDSMPNPLSFNVSRIYVTLKPGLVGPGNQVNPLRIGG